MRDGSTLKFGREAGRSPYAHATAVVILLLLGIVAGPPAKGADPIEITGQVLDAAGKPAAGLRVSSGWISEEGRWMTRKGTRTDAEGNFSFQTRLSSRARSLMAFDATQEHGAVVTLDAEAAEKPIVLKLRPTTLVRAAFASTGLGYDDREDVCLLHGAAGEDRGRHAPGRAVARPATAAGRLRRDGLGA